MLSFPSGCAGAVCCEPAPLSRPPELPGVLQTSADAQSAEFRVWVVVTVDSFHDARGDLMSHYLQWNHGGVFKYVV